MNQAESQKGSRGIVELFLQILIVCSTSAMSGEIQAQDAQLPDGYLEKANAIIDSIVEDVRPRPVFSEREWAILAPEQLVELTSRTAHNDDPVAMLSAFSYVLRAVKMTDNHLIHQQAVELVVERLVGSEHEENWHTGYRILQWFSEEDFNEQSKSMLSSILKSRDVPDGKEVRLFGIAGMKSEISYLRSLVRPIPVESDGSNTKTLGQRFTGWHAQLALARLGESDWIDICVARIARNLQGNTRRFLQDVAYIRQPQSVNLLFQILDGREFGLLDVERDFAVQRSAQLLVECLEDFPLPVGRDTDHFRSNAESLRFMPHDIDHCRRWAENKTTLNIRR